MPDLFAQALDEMDCNATPVWGPQSFRAYVSRQGFGQLNTPLHISVDSLRKLPAALRDRSVMIFRLGSPAGEKHTHFALARLVGDWSDYFLIDHEIFADLEPEVFVPPVSPRQLFAFRLLPRFTETSLVNLAIASGLMAHALKIDRCDLPYAAATGQGKYSFEVGPHAQIGVLWKHEDGQVELDAVFTARRGGKEIVFVVEAKAGKLDSLAKHKLVYPLLAIRSRVPPNMALVPVYLRAMRVADGMHFYIAECSEFRMGNSMNYIASLSPMSHSHHVLTNGVV